MKRIFLAILAVAALAACNKSEVVESAPSAEIAFDDVFVDNATKAADLTASNLADFGVYGTVAKNNQSGPIFENQKVQKSGTSFIYSPAQYWVPSAEYTFSAIAPYQAGDNATWTYDAQTAKITFHNDIAQANQDLLFAYAERETEASITSKPAAVGFTFNHQLARARFTFTNDFGAESNIQLVVKNVTITNVHKTGILAVTVDANGVATTAWEGLADNTVPANVFARVFNQNADLTLAPAADAATGAVTAAATEHFYLIPSNAAFNVTFDVDLYQAGVLLDTYKRTATLQYNMQIGYSYDIKATLNSQNTSDEGELYPIEFSVDKVDEWETFTGVDATVNK